MPRAVRSSAVALDDRQQARHARDLLDLLLDEPLHELLAGVVAELTRKGCKRADLLGHPPFLGERERDRRDDIGEARLGRANPWDGDVEPGVEQVLHHHHRVVSLLK